MEWYERMMAMMGEQPEPIQPMLMNLGLEDMQMPNPQGQSLGVDTTSTIPEEAKGTTILEDIFGGGGTPPDISQYMKSGTPAGRSDLQSLLSLMAIKGQQRNPRKGYSMPQGMQSLMGG